MINLRAVSISCISLHQSSLWGHEARTRVIRCKVGSCSKQYNTLMIEMILLVQFCSVTVFHSSCLDRFVVIRFGFSQGKQHMILGMLPNLSTLLAWAGCALAMKVTSLISGRLSKDKIQLERADHSVYILWEPKITTHESRRLKNAVFPWTATWSRSPFSFAFIFAGLRFLFSNPITSWPIFPEFFHVYLSCAHFPYVHILGVQHLDWSFQYILRPWHISFEWTGGSKPTGAGGERIESLEGVCDKPSLRAMSLSGDAEDYDGEEFNGDDWSCNGMITSNSWKLGQEESSTASRSWSRSEEGTEASVALIYGWCLESLIIWVTKNENTK